MNLITRFLSNHLKLSEKSLKNQLKTNYSRTASINHERTGQDCSCDEAESCEERDKHYLTILDNLNWLPFRSSIKKKNYLDSLKGRRDRIVLIY